VERRKKRPLSTMRLAVVSLLAIAAAPAVASISVAQAAPIAAVPCHSSFNPYRYTPAQLRTCGYVTYPRIAAVALPGGGSAVEYRMKGAIVKNLIPPKGFHPETATAAQLNEYGFPARPGNPALLARWKKEMSTWKSAAPPSQFLVETNMKADTQYSSTWAGYVITAEPGSISAFSHAEGWWYEPTFASSRCSSTTEVTWAGLGGWNGITPLAQNGTAWNSNGVDAHEAWWEIYPYNNLMAINYYGTPGVIFDASVRVIDTGYRFWFYNWSGQSMAFDEPFTGSSNSLTAEVVIERPTVGNSPTNLANFQTLNVYQSEAWINYFTNGNTFDTFPANLNTSTGLQRHGVHMHNNATGDDLADPGNIFASGGFDVSQHNCN